MTRFQTGLLLLLTLLVVCASRIVHNLWTSFLNCVIGVMDFAGATVRSDYQWSNY